VILVSGLAISPVDLSLCLNVVTRRCRPVGEMGRKIHAFLLSALDISLPCCCLRRKDFRADFDVLAKRKISACAGNRTPSIHLVVSYFSALLAGL
jgi:hypothetical protein